MLSISLALLAAGAASPITCPSSLRHHGRILRLTGMSVFDGDPAERADLVPDQRGSGARRRDRWDLAPPDPGRHYVAVCRYDQQAAQRDFVLGPAVKSCTFTLTPRRGRCV